MVQLSIGAACAYVRKILDELISVEEIGMIASPDAINLHKLVEGAIVEAVVKTHSSAPAIMIDGIVGTAGTDYKEEWAKGVLGITMLKDTLRIASVKAHDSEVIVTELIPEDSAEGRKQLNEYIRGVPDDPRVVLEKTWQDDNKPRLKYYTCANLAGNDTEEETTEKKSMVELCYVPYPVIDETIVLVCPRLEYAVLNEIAAMILDSINEHDKATLYRTKSKGYMMGNN